MSEDPQKAIIRRLIDRIDILGTISSSPDNLTRIFLSREMDTAARLIQTWMSNAGLVANTDPMQNVVGSWPNANATTPSIHLGSHFDTVVNAGKFDGTLGVLLSIAAMEMLRLENYEPKHHLNVLAFCDEEGIRFNSTFLGSSYFCGTFNLDFLRRRDDQGHTMGDLLARRGMDLKKFNTGRPLIQANDLFIEAHIEQGPVLESLDIPLGVVSGIAAQTRLLLTVSGKSGHAGTVPLGLRKDALTASAEMILAVESVFAENVNSRCTVGKIVNLPNAINAIPGQTQFTIDIRHPVTAGLIQTKDRLLSIIESIASRREIDVEIEETQTAESIACDKSIQRAISQAISKYQSHVTSFTSGAGHDSLKIAQTCRTGMMFIRCREGISHHPDEFVSSADIETALYAWTDTIKELDQNFPQA